MVIIIIILTAIIIILLTYLFLLQKELKSLPNKIDTLQKNDSNHLINIEHDFKTLEPLIMRINHLLKGIKEVKLSYERKNKMMMTMMANISHDLRTPLTSAIGYIDIVLKSDIGEEEKQTELKIVEERLEKLEELINSFFEFAKALKNDRQPELKKLDLLSILEDSIVSFYDDYKKENRKILLNHKNKKIMITSNEIMLARIFDNLITNAYQHSSSDLEIEVTTDEKTAIKFRNDLTDEETDIERMFDEFYTTDISRTKGNTGLGLALAKEFVSALGGNIYAQKSDSKIDIVIEL